MIFFFLLILIVVYIIYFQVMEMEKKVHENEFLFLNLKKFI